MVEVVVVVDVVVVVWWCLPWLCDRVIVVTEGVGRQKHVVCALQKR